MLLSMILSFFEWGGAGGGGGDGEMGGKFIIYHQK